MCFMRKPNCCFLHLKQLSKNPLTGLLSYLQPNPSLIVHTNDKMYPIYDRDIPFDILEISKNTTQRYMCVFVLRPCIYHMMDK